MKNISFTLKDKSEVMPINTFIFTRLATLSSWIPGSFSFNAFEDTKLRQHLQFFEIFESIDNITVIVKKNMLKGKQTPTFISFE